MANDNNFKFKHILNGIWTLSMFDDLNIIFKGLSSVANFYGYTLLLLIVALTMYFGLQYECNSIFETSIIFSFVALNIINVTSLLFGIYSTMILFPGKISWFLKLGVMAVLLFLYNVLIFFLEKRTKGYINPIKYNFLETLIIGLTGLSVIEDIYFIGISTHLLMVSLSLPLHIHITILSMLLLSLLIGISSVLYFNKTSDEAYNKSDLISLCFMGLDAAIKTMTIFTVISCIWFNITILPVSNLFLSSSISILLTALFSFFYFYTEMNFTSIKNKSLNLKNNPQLNNSSFNKSRKLSSKFFKTENTYVRYIKQLKSKNNYLKSDLNSPLPKVDIRDYNPPINLGINDYNPPINQGFINDNLPPNHGIRDYNPPINQGIRNYNLPLNKKRARNPYSSSFNREHVAAALAACF